MHGFSQEYLAGRIEVSPKTYRQMESGKAPLTVERMDKIARIFGISTEQLLHCTPSVDHPFASGHDVHERVALLEKMVLQLIEEVSALRKNSKGGDKQLIYKYSDVVPSVMPDRRPGKSTSGGGSEGAFSREKSDFRLIRRAWRMPAGYFR